MDGQYFAETYTIQNWYIVVCMFGATDAGKNMVSCLLVRCHRCDLRPTKFWFVWHGGLVVERAGCRVKEKITFAMIYIERKTVADV